MSTLKWFAGGQERRQEALTLLDQLERDLEGQSDTADLLSLLSSYHQELDQSGTALPYVLSRLSVELSALLRKEQLTLTLSQKECLDHLRQLSYIRYGY